MGEPGVPHAKKDVSRRGNSPGRERNSLREVLAHIERWRGRGDRLALATLVAARRSAPRPVAPSSPCRRAARSRGRSRAAASSTDRCGRRPLPLRHEGARSERRRARGRLAGRGARARAARPRHRDRRPHSRRPLRHHGADGRAPDGGVLHRGARLAAQPGAPARAPARGGGIRSRPRADRRPGRARHRAQSPAETALSILAEAVAARSGHGGGPLKESPDRIHAERPG
jgi:hypothetical protein